MAGGQNPVYNRLVAFTKSDTVDEPGGKWDAIYVGGAGNLVIVQEDGTAVTLAVVAGAILPIRGKRINNTNTTATAVFLLYQV